jgi:small subunit ribosomal protein S10e
MVQIQKSEKKAVYRYLLQEGVIVLHKDFTTQPHKGTNVANIHVRTLLRSLKDRGFVELVFNWQYFYYFINTEGKKYLSEFLGLTEEVVPLTWKYPILHSGRTRRDSTNTSSRTVERESEESAREVLPRARGEEAEELPVARDAIEKTNNLPPKPSSPPPQLDRFIPLRSPNFKHFYPNSIY